MLRVALTGGIATGKSFCAARFAELGVPVIDADRLARKAVAPGSAGLRAVVSRFGASVLLPDGGLVRGSGRRGSSGDAVLRSRLRRVPGAPRR